MTGSDLDSLLAAQSRSYRAAGEGLKRSWPEANALDRDGLRALIDDVHYGVLATSRPNGRAHATPVAFSLADGAFWIGSVEGRRLANLRETPWAARHGHPPDWAVALLELRPERVFSHGPRGA